MGKNKLSSYVIGDMNSVIFQEGNRFVWRGRLSLLDSDGKHGPLLFYLNSTLGL